MNRSASWYTGLVRPRSRPRCQITPPVPRQRPGPASRPRPAAPGPAVRPRHRVSRQRPGPVQPTSRPRPAAPGPAVRPRHRVPRQQPAQPSHRPPPPPLDHANRYPQLSQHGQTSRPRPIAASIDISTGGADGDYYTSSNPADVVIANGACGSSSTRGRRQKVLFGGGRIHGHLNPPTLKIYFLLGFRPLYFDV